MQKSRRERFEEIAVLRTNRILDTLRLLGNCSNKNNYEYSEEDVKKIFAAIEKEVRDQKAKFTNQRNNRKFTLDTEDE